MKKSSSAAPVKTQPDAAVLPSSGFASTWHDFEEAGYVVVKNVISAAACATLTAQLPAIESAGSRTLLALRPYRDLARQLRTQLTCVPGNLVAVECILFNKSVDYNWAVRLHRDAVLPIKGTGIWQSAGIKEGLACAMPPREFMDRCIAVRVQLDGATVEDISVVPGSHKTAESYDRACSIAIRVNRGGALIMRPTLAHGSSKLKAVQHRRVLHYLFAPTTVPAGYDWYHAA